MAVLNYGGGSRTTELVQEKLQVVLPSTKKAIFSLEAIWN
jgi:hypothetical protein